MNIQKVRLELVKKAMREGVPPGAIPGLVDRLAGFVVHGLVQVDKEISEGEKIDRKYAETLLRKIQQRFGKESAFSVELNEHAFVMNVSDAFKNLIELEIKGPNAPDWLRGRRVELIVTPPKKP
ncbi:hypothetical protein KWF06_10415 [Acinetobacter baumannii]|uniref:hypothetical protein n=1 Tax=Acinetobacter baumannii TaxID=470 RepID=UPI0010CB572A|nr:hypothetical protein [Acinetobacter baumannii]MDC5119482.1 hypothetical protein [Acinetobacter baumannii]TKV70037.1 hypothetical protein D9Y30_01490 [Acinetobacter baumannii]HEO1829083.1 hypothetical protein [Acinetobacter baumannii]